MEPFRFTIISYNIHHGRGLDHHLDMNRIASVIADTSADVVCLQEVDYRVVRSRFINQPAALASALSMERVFGATLRWPGGQRYGNLLLSRLPIESSRHHLMSGRGERRGIIEARLTTPAGPITVLNTHWGLPEADRTLHAARSVALLTEAGRPTLLAGDLNEETNGPNHALLRDAGLAPLGPPEPTFPADAPSIAIDHVYGTRHFTAREAYTIPSLASDHRPVVVELEMRVAAPGDP